MARFLSALRRARARASTTSAAWTWSSRSGRSPRSPACRARARAPSSRTSCTRRSPQLNGAREPGGTRLDRGPRGGRQGHRDRPEPDRPDAALEPGDLHRPVHAHPRAVRRGARGARPRLRPGRFCSTSRAAAARTARATAIIKIEMQFLPDVYVPCEVCGGKRYNREALEIHYKGRSIADVLEMTVEEALEFFSPVPADPRKLQTLVDVGPRLHPPGPARDDPVRRRGAAGQARDRAVTPRDRQDRLPARRADDRPALR